MNFRYWLKPRRLIGVGLIIGLIVAAAWSINQYKKIDSAHTLKVAATFYPLYNIAQAIGGDLVTVTNITPAGAEPHEYAPTPQQLIELERAKVFIYNGATFEPWVDQFLSTYSGEKVAASQGVSLMPATEADTLLATDPHFWLDPVEAQQIVVAIRDGLIAADPDHAATYRQNAARYSTQLAQLARRFDVGLRTCAMRTVVSSHDALSYLARRYNFSVESIAGISPTDDPSPAKLAQLSQLIQQKNISTVLFETLVSPKLAQTLASEAGATTAVFDPLEGLSDEDIAKGANYISVQKDNLAILREAMKCQ